MGTYDTQQYMDLFGGLPDRGEAAIDPRELADRERGERKDNPACGFCGGQPVGNAATFVDGVPRPSAACPRCGETHEAT